ncbi:NF-kappa-B inhibitor-interacting Ras-like protein 1 isoform X2 [Oopsacas minuta]|uniref:NF-kappa-B inhibitor-interacting Ras-like protein 1 isoform X2 n=1 Tax=Oopsacas minuta TaxID=111878 RepID=A0AAV7JPS5_9METZ|nr:NF-kappa-B inhibitor-interacting Ras-like protein 1 isoform X2 [Oopsacas minuta]
MASIHKPFKIIVLGDLGTGKTGVIQHLIFGNHIIQSKDVPYTIEDIYKADINIGKGVWYRVCLFDTSGKSLYDDQLLEHYISIAEGIVLTYNITEKPTFDTVIQLRKKISERHKDIPIIILGTHSDYEDSRQVDKLSTIHWAEMQKLSAFEVTLTSRETLREPFVSLVTNIAISKGLPVTKK